MSKKIKVLMVDDEERFRETTDKILTRRGFETIMAESGAQAFEKLEQNPDVVILDIRMKGMDGHETLWEIKKRRPDLPVIMLTGYGDMDSARQAHDQGAFDYLAKPCDIDVLAGKIRDAVQSMQVPERYQETPVSGVMIPIEEYTTLMPEVTVREAILEIKKSFATRATSRIMETGHRSVLVIDRSRNVIGVLAINGLMEMILPGYLSAPRPSTADSIQYSPMFWRGMFQTEVKNNADMPIGEVMSPAPYSIDAEASLMEATYFMVQHKARRLIVRARGKVVGIIREQDLFFEMEKILRSGSG
ncbi:MAG: response regulator [Desulfobacteraceae bacterium]|nr:response regulator [Desulfobacteraceae bacterium]